MSSIYDFVAQEHETSRLMPEGERVSEAKHVFACNVKEKDENCCTLVGFVLQTSAVSGDPHELEITLRGRHVSAASCTCKAG